MNWTDERPTEPGEYWLSLKPSSRAGILPTKGYPLAVTAFLHSGDPCVGINGVAFGMEARCFDGALWAPRETPADPFAKADTMRTDKDGREYNHDDREAKLQPELLIKKAIQHLRKRKPRNGRGYVYPLWKRVADLFGHGSGYSAEICRRYGFDPDEQWMPEQQCPDCKRMVDPEELRPAPCNYEQDVNGNDTPYVMCRSCRAERNDAI